MTQKRNNEQVAQNDYLIAIPFYMATQQQHLT